MSKESKKIQKMFNEISRTHPNLRMALLFTEDSYKARNTRIITNQIQVKDDVIMLSTVLYSLISEYVSPIKGNEFKDYVDEVLPEIKLVERKLDEGEA